MPASQPNSIVDLDTVFRTMLNSFPLVKFLPFIIGAVIVRIAIESTKNSKHHRRSGGGKRGDDDKATVGVIILLLLIGLVVYLWNRLGPVVFISALLGLLVLSSIIGFLLSRKSRRGTGIGTVTSSPRQNQGNSVTYVPQTLQSESKSPEVLSGEMGEARVRSILKNLPPEQYFVMNDMWSPIKNGGENQIDHIVVSKFGIFVIETKNWKGNIRGAENELNWIKYNCGYKEVLYNPILQNKRHIKTIYEKFASTEQDFVFGIVAMGPYAEFPDRKVPNGVIYWNELQSWIFSHTKEVICQTQIPEIIFAFQQWDSMVSLEERVRHCQ